MVNLSMWLLLPCVLFLSFYSRVHAGSEYMNDVYDALVRYAYISKMSYCIGQIIGEQDLSEPLIISPKPFSFIQNDYNPNDYYGLGNKEKTMELHIAKLIYPVKKGDEAAQGFFAIDHRGNGTIILSLRGTANTMDYLTDINIQTIDYEPITESGKKKFEEMHTCNNCKVHNGFYKRFKELDDQIFPTFDKLIEVFPQYRIVITGHSMGGSLANLVGLELSLMGHRPLVIAYGSPKVSNADLSNFMDRMFFTEELFNEDIMEYGSLTEGSLRVVHKGDFVPLLPPGNSFVQSGFEFYIEKEQLPHPKGMVQYNGKARYIQHDIKLNFWDIFSFNIEKIFHLKEHAEYFYPISSCGDIDEKAMTMSFAAEAEQ